MTEPTTALVAPPTPGTGPSPLTPLLARRVVETVGSTGTPPEWGFQHFSAGLDAVLRVLDEDYLASYLADGGASFKLLVGTYGGGKTHFLYSTRALAWERGYPVAYVALSHDESPFHRLERVYGAIVRNLALPVAGDGTLAPPERGIRPLLEEWTARLDAAVEPELELEDRRPAILALAQAALKSVASVQLQKAVAQAVEAIVSRDEQALSDLVQWLSAEGYARETHRRYGLLHGIDRTVALTMLRSLSQLVRAMGHPGLVILFDEAEQVPSLSSKQRDALLSNLRELIDECGHHHFQGVLMLYAVPDESFFEGRSSVYEALNQRIATLFQVFNPTGVKIRLDDLGLDPVPLLEAIGNKLAGIYETAYGTTLPGVERAVAAVAKAAYEQRFGDIGYKRLFVQAIVRACHLLRSGQTDARGVTSDVARGLVSGQALGR